MMKKAYLLIYSNHTASRETIKKWAESDPKIIFWRYDLPNTFCLISENPAEELRASMEKFINRSLDGIIVEMNVDYALNSDKISGNMPPHFWHLVAEKEPLSEELYEEVWGKNKKDNNKK